MKNTIEIGELDLRYYVLEEHQQNQYENLGLGHVIQNIEIQ